MKRKRPTRWERDFLALIRIIEQKCKEDVRLYDNCKWHDSVKRDIGLSCRDMIQAWEIR